MEKNEYPFTLFRVCTQLHFYDINYLKSHVPGGSLRHPPNSDKEVVKGLLKASDKTGENEIE